MINILAVPEIAIGTPSERKAQQLFDDTFRAGQIKSWFSILFGKSRCLMKINDSRTDSSINNQHYIGAHVVPLKQVRGTLDKVDSFDVDFHPLHKRNVCRWLDIALAMLHDAYLPPVEFIKMGSVYYVSDGHHRVSVARAMKKDFIDAVVIVRA